jgi:aromatic ring-cleaving dioxygenase
MTTATPRPQNLYDRYHAHVYFDMATVAQATALCQQAGVQFNLPVGHIHRQPVGPHPSWSCQISFKAEDFESFIPWLDRERHGLTVLVHGVTDDDLADHTDHAAWLGEAQALNLAMFQKTA